MPVKTKKKAAKGPSKSRGERMVLILLFLTRNHGQKYKIREIQEYVEGKLEQDADIRSYQRDIQDLMAIAPGIIHQYGNAKEGFIYSAQTVSTAQLNALRSYSLNEAIAAHVIRKLAPALKGTSYTREFSNLLERIEGTFPDDVISSELGDDSEEALKGLEFNSFGLYDMSAKANEFEAIIDAIRKRRKINLSYARKDGDPWSYVYRPLKIVFHNGMPYLHARNDAKGFLNSFRIDKVVGVKILSETFDYDADWEAAKQEIGSKGIGVWHNKDTSIEKVSLLFDPDLKDRIINRFWHPSQKFIEERDGSLRLDLNVAVNEELISWIFYWQGMAKVLAPASLISTIKDRASTIASDY
ncbi:MAG: WYL domain-containing protein [Fibrobacteres bacterium]|nr:WYL domain-containing protein [Fibrobacterota bacterium]